MSCLLLVLYLYFSFYLIMKIKKYTLLRYDIVMLHRLIYSTEVWYCYVTQTNILYWGMVLLCYTDCMSSPPWEYQAWCDDNNRNLAWQSHQQTSWKWLISPSIDETDPSGPPHWCFLQTPGVWSNISVRAFLLVDIRLLSYRL